MKRALASIFLIFSASWLAAQSPTRSGGATPKAMAPIDLTGQWVAVITEDWRWRMATPAKGDFTSVPLNAQGRKVGNMWDPSADEASGNQCRSYGAPALMRVPGRIRFMWADDETLRVETDAGMQNRTFYFKSPASQGGDWQGASEASWDMVGGPRGSSPQGGSLHVVTTRFKAGYLRKNGVPYSDKAVLTEYYDVTRELNGDSWLIITTIVDDPTYLQQPFITSSNFKKQRDTSGWKPTPCSAW
jgi:hypothetical protein